MHAGAEVLEVCHLQLKLPDAESQLTTQNHHALARTGRLKRRHEGGIDD